MVLDGCPRVAPAYLGRKWVLRMLFSLLSNRLFSKRGYCLTTCRKRSMGFARLFRPRYALANLGHPSRTIGRGNHRPRLGGWNVRPWLSSEKESAAGVPVQIFRPRLGGGDTLTR